MFHTRALKNRKPFFFLECFWLSGSVKTNSKRFLLRHSPLPLASAHWVSPRDGDGASQPRQLKKAPIRRRRLRTLFARFKIGHTPWKNRPPALAGNATSHFNAYLMCSRCNCLNADALDACRVLNNYIRAFRLLQVKFYNPFVFYM